MKIDLTDCYTRLPKPMEEKVDLWATRTLGKSSIRSPSSNSNAFPCSSHDAVVVEQPFTVHHTGAPDTPALEPP
jgi:hypothetical protein